MDPAPGTIVEVTPTAFVAGGDALARAADGRVVLVAGALPGERVRVEITEARATMLRARTVTVVEPSPDRVEPPCVHRHAGCGGCPWQFVAPAAQPALKREIAADALRRLARIDDAPLQDTIPLPATGYRTTVRALVDGGRPAFRARRAHDPVRIDGCLVAHPLVDAVLRAGDFTGAREVTVRAGVASGERLVLADPADRRVTVPDGVAQGPRAHVHEEVAGHRFRVGARSFFQVRPDGAAALAALVRDATGPDRRVVDLYAGVGLFAATVAAPRHVVAVEGSRAAVADARANLRGRPAEVVHADVGRWRGRPADVVVADPSRTGLRDDGVAAVLRCDPQRVVLVSCDPAAMARDVRLLHAAGFALTSVTPVDLFPHTAHVECVSVLDRG